MDLAGLRLLLVEDDEILRELTATALRKAGLDVTEAETGAEALRWLADPPDVLFTDIRLPGGVDGWRVAEQFRAVKPSLPILYATAYNKAQSPVEGSMFFRKPYKIQQVLLAIAALVGAPQSS
jgi:CheY-like chemotaxis protein